MSNTVEIEMGEFIDIDISQNGKVLPPKNDMIALIDADTIIFGACAVKEYCETVDVGVGDMDFQEIFAINIEDAYTHALDKIVEILQATGCQDYELHFTIGRNSFRYTRVDEEYKANRLGGRAPAGLKELKTLFCERRPDKAFMWSEFEADDVVILKKKLEPEKYMLCAVDKDVLFTLPGRHFNYYSRADYNIEMKFIEVEEINAMKHMYFQVLMGDSGDNVIGLKGVGKVGANKLLANCSTPSECYEVCEQAYRDKGRCDTDLIKNMRLISMHQLVVDGDVYKVVLWKDAYYTCINCRTDISLTEFNTIEDLENDGDINGTCPYCNKYSLLVEN